MILLLLVQSMAGLRGLSQPNSYIFRHLTVNEGLINDKVTALCQDDAGYMWIGTQAGLQRYDGTRFRTFQADIRDSSALHSDWISAIFEDSKKRLWIGNDHGGPYLLNRQTGKFYNFNLHAPTGKKINSTWFFAEDSQGSIWISGYDGFYQLNEKTFSFEPCHTIIGLPQKTNTGSLTIDKEDNLWLSTTNGLYYYSRKEKKLYDSKNPYPSGNPLFTEKEGPTTVIRKGNELWASFSRKVIRYNLDTQKSKTYSFDNHSPNNQGPEVKKDLIGSVYCLPDGTVIISLMLRGFAVYRPETDDFFVIRADNTAPYGFHLNKNLANNLQILQDREKNVWIGTSSGINIFNPGKQLFHTHKTDTGRGDLFPEETVTGFLQNPDGNVFISYYNTNGGIVKADSNLRFKRQFLYKENGNEHSSINQTWTLFKDKKNILWAPNQRGSILKLQLDTEELTEVRDTVLSGAINTIKQDSGNIVWIGHWKKGLIRMDTRLNTRKVFPTAKRVYSLLVEKDKVWVGTFQDGLQVFDKKKEQFVEGYSTDEDNPRSISSNCVSDILRYNEDTLILATEMGINIFDIRKKTFRAITAKEGLPDNIALAVMKDDAGNIWAAGGSGGFSRLNLHPLCIAGYDQLDGIADNVFTSGFYRLRSGTVLIGTSAGFISFDPLRITKAEPPPDLRITGIQVFNKDLRVDSLLATGSLLTLPYQENSLRIAFSSLEYWSPGRLRYYYKLEGVDEDWVPADKNNIAVYNQLEKGDYVFRVKCANRDGVYSVGAELLTITIKPPFWKTGWFVFLMVAGFVGLVLWFVKWRERHIKAIESEKLKVQKVNAEQYKSKWEMEQIINYFSSSLIHKHTVDDVLWDVAKNLIGRLDFVDCIIYLWNEDKTKMIQKAGFGSKESIDQLNSQVFEVFPGQGVVGYVVETKEPVIIDDTSLDHRYRPDDMVRSSELAVPLIYNNELIGVIDSEHHEKGFFTDQHLQILSTIATLVTNKIKSIEAEESLHQQSIEMITLSEKLSRARLEALRSQMNPHFIFNSLNAIQECILTNKVGAAYEYLSKFSKLQRMVLNSSEKEWMPLSDEIEMMQYYLSLESLRFNQAFSYKLDITGIPDVDEVRVPSLITQPFVENAIWHGLRNKEGVKTLVITYRETEGLITITVDDNGIGREMAAVIRQQKLGNDRVASKGILLLQKRMQILRQQFKAELSFTIVDKKDEEDLATGTTVIISFPSNL
ncbi:sensor histidine kinase [Flavitalea flava]